MNERNRPSLITPPSVKKMSRLSAVNVGVVRYYNSYIRELTWYLVMMHTFIMYYRKQYGFTVVELLIVIIVIAVLASVAIVAYNGIQLRAKNTAIENVVSVYKKALSSYVAINGYYPLTSNSCIGAVLDYPSGCYSAGPEARMEDALKTVISGALPQPDKSCFTMYSGCRRSISFQYSTTWTIDGAPHKNYLVYFLYGNSICALGTLEGGYGNFASTTSRGYMERDSGTTMCIQALPDLT